MATISFYPSGRVAATVAEVGAFMDRGETPQREDGQFYDVEEFQGGLLFDGLPLNVILDNTWIEGQQEALLAAGHHIPGNALTLPTVTPDAGVSQYFLYAGIAFAAWRIFR